MHKGRATEQQIQHTALKFTNAFSLSWLLHPLPVSVGQGGIRCSHSHFPKGSPITLSHLTSLSSTLLQCFPTNLLLQTDLKLPEVPKSSFHWCQWFRVSAVLSRRHVLDLFVSFINDSESTMYRFTSHLSQLCINLLFYVAIHILIL